MEDLKFKILKSAAKQNQVCCGEVDMDMVPFLNLCSKLVDEGLGTMNGMSFIINDKGREILGL